MTVRDPHSPPQSAQIGIAIVEWDGRILVGVRDPNTVLGGKHEFPGGKCFPGESPAACAVRECFEETGLRVEVNELLIHNRHTYDHGTLDLSFFLCSPAEDVPASLLGNFCWRAITELAELNFPGGNRAAVQKLLDRRLGRVSQQNLA